MGRHCYSTGIVKRAMTSVLELNCSQAISRSYPTMTFEPRRKPQFAPTSGALSRATTESSFTLATRTSVCSAGVRETHFGCFEEMMSYSAPRTAHVPLADAAHDVIAIHSLDFQYKHPEAFLQTTARSILLSRTYRLVFTLTICSTASTAVLDVTPTAR
jgi:hypothetical protein